MSKSYCRVMMTCLPILSAILLLGCEAAPKPEPVIVTRDVYKAVPVSCVPANLGEAPDYPDSNDALKAAGGMDARYQLLIAGREARTARLNEVEPVVKGCRQPDDAAAATAQGIKE